MDILQTILAAQNGGAVKQLGSQFGLGEEQTTSALSALVPVLAAGFQRNLSNEGGIGNLIFTQWRARGNRNPHPIPEKYLYQLILICHHLQAIGHRVKSPRGKFPAILPF